MSLELQLAVVCILLPAAVSAAVLMATPYFFGTTNADRAAGPVALAVAFAAAYLAHPWTALVPSDNWHWLLYLAIASGAAASIIHAAGLTIVPRLVLMLLATAAAAWVLVPAWLDLEPYRNVYRLVLGLSLFASWTLLDALLARREGSADPFLLCGVSVAAVAVIILSGNSKFAQLMLACVSALASCTAIGWFWGRATLQAAAGPLTVLLVGLLFSAYLNSFSTVPTASYVLVCAAPAGLWLDRVFRVQGRMGILIRSAGALVPSLVAIVLAIS